MQIQIAEEPIATLAAQGEISIAYKYNSVLELTLEDSGIGGFALEERLLDDWRSKDYDAFAGERPGDWCKRFDVSNWGFIVARSDGRRVGGAVIAYDTPGVEMLEGRTDLAVLWDIRVDTGMRGYGIGTKLFAAVTRWAMEKRCTQLKIETQNTNIAACKFYEQQGCKLGAINRMAYPTLPDEIQLIWYKDLTMLVPI